jgi:hypothetical protein
LRHVARIVEIEHYAIVQRKHQEIVMRQPMPGHSLHQMSLFDDESPTSN